MSQLGKITFLLHTCNRPEFLLRTLDYFDNLFDASEFRLFLLDASDEQHWNRFQEGVSLRDYSFDYTLFKADPTTLFYVRLAEALSVVDTPYVILAADDDFYLPGWFDDAVLELDRCPDVAAIMGHNLFFEIQGNGAYGSVVDYFVHPRRVPELKWLEHDSAEGRLASISDGRGEPATPAWYALQRVQPLQAACSIAAEAEAGLFFEYVQIFCQVAMGKVRMLDHIMLARQHRPQALHPAVSPGVARDLVARLTPACSAFLEQQIRLSKAEARATTRRYFQGIFCQSVREHGLSHQLRRLLLQIPLVAWLIQNARGSVSRSLTQSYADPRFPELPTLSSDHPIIEMVRRETIDNHPRKPHGHVPRDAHACGEA